MDYRRVLYVGGLDQSVSEEVLQAAFIAFGPIRAVEVPQEIINLDEGRSLPHTTFDLPFEQQQSLKQSTSEDGQQRGKKVSRGFGYVEFEEAEDASAAKDNMDGAELQGRVLRVDVAKKESLKIGARRPQWHQLNEWYRQKLNKEGFINDSEASEFDRKASAARKGR